MAIDLEEEFSKLMREVYDKIKANEAAGTYSQWEASELEDRLTSLLEREDRSRYGQRCPQGHPDIEECGWSPSMGYHCT